MVVLGRVQTSKLKFEVFASTLYRNTSRTGQTLCIFSTLHTYNTRPCLLALFSSLLVSAPVQVSFHSGMQYRDMLIMTMA